ncbi:MAG: Na+/H+ antiporter [Rikenellaceae bacterium]|nr:Na+/H+ antiporter [Rikenellaceae bacterium]
MADGLPMEYYHIIIIIFALVIALSAVAPRIKLPYPILLILTGICVGFIPHIQYVPVDPDIVFLIFLPPLLYDAALNISFPGFKKNIGTISMLAVTMVLVTMTAIAAVAHFFIPGISWPVGFVIGAILSPPDAIAASGILRNMKLPERTATILEGESLVNDATALTVYRIALGVVAGGVFVFWKAAVEFLAVIAGGLVVGVVMGWLFSKLLRYVNFTSTAVVSLNILLPFVAYQLAESFDASGVLAVVALGLYTSRRVNSGCLFSRETMNQARSVWSVIIYLLSGFIFILIGLEFPQVLHGIPEGTIKPLIGSSFLIFVIALAVRILFIFEHKWRTDRLHLRHIHHHPHEREKKQVRSLDWKNALVIGWSGMRGIVSVATAIALPTIFAGGEKFPQRDSIVFLTVTVVILMLVIQGIGLPILVKLLRIDTSGDKKEM